MEAVAVDAFDKHHRVTIAGLLELALGQSGHAGVSLGFRQHFILMARRPRPRPHHVDRRHRAGEQREDHRRLDQHGFAQAAGVHHRNFTFGVQLAEGHQQAKEQT